MKAPQSVERHWTPKEISRELNVSWEKVVAWIRAGELQAIDVSARGSRLPRYVVSQSDYDDFKRARAVVPKPAPSPRRRRRQSDPTVRDYVG